MQDAPVMRKLAIMKKLMLATVAAASMAAVIYYMAVPALPTGGA